VRFLTRPFELYLKSENILKIDNNQEKLKSNVKGGINPIWFLFGMGILIGLILVAELMGLKAK
jgi:hypothetical protein